MMRFSTARSVRAAMLSATLLTGACASVPDLGAKPEISAPTTFASSASLGGSQAAWPADGWWLRYRDPQLARLIDEALISSPDLEAAAARMRTAEGFAQRAGAALKPSIDAFSQPELAKQSQNQSVPAAMIPNGWNDSGSMGLSLSLDLDLWGKNRAALRAANADADAARYEMEAAKLALTTGIASTYAELASLHAQRDTLESALAIRTETAKLVAQRTAIGLDTRAELKQAEARIPQTQADLESTDEAIALTRNALAALVARGLRASLVAWTSPGLPAPVSDGLSVVLGVCAGVFGFTLDGAFGAGAGEGAPAASAVAFSSPGSRYSGPSHGIRKSNVRKSCGRDTGS